MTARISGTIEKFLSGNGLSDDQFSANLITSSVDLEGDTTLASGVTPSSGTVPLLWGHDPQKVVGKADFRVVGNIVKMVCTLIPEGTTPEGNLARACTKGGDFGMGVSAGFQPLETLPKKGGRGKTYSRVLILEASIVAVPCDPSARITARSHDEGRRARIEKAESIGRTIRADDAAAMGRRIRADDARALALPAPTRAERVARALELAPEQPRRPLFNAQAFAERADKHAQAVAHLQATSPESRAGRIAIAKALAPKK